MADDLRVLTWNLQGSKGVDTAAVVALLARFRPDVVVLQEIQRRQLARLAARAATDLWPGGPVRRLWTLKHYPYTPLVWWKAEGLGLLIRCDLTNSGSMVLTPGRSRWTYRRRVMQWATSAGADGPFTVVNVHLASSADAGAERDEQAAMVAAQVAAGDPARTIVAGDLNGDSDTAPLAPFRALGLIDAWATAGDGAGATNPAGAAHQRLDYVLVGGAWQVVAADMPADVPDMARLSDHLPVAVGMRRSPEAAAV